MAKLDPNSKTRLAMNLKLNRQAVLVFILLLFVYSYFISFPNVNWNINSRLGLIFALVHEGRFTIDSFHDQPDTFTNDKAFYNGHYYSDKAIGSSLLGALVYLPFYWFAKLFKTEFDFYSLRYVLTFFVVGIPSALAGCLMYRLCEHLSQDRWHAYVTTIAIMVGTMSFPFSTLLFGHQLAAALLFITFFMMVRIKLNPQSHRAPSAFLIGLLLGVTLITEYTTMVVVLPLIGYYFYVLSSEKLWRTPSLVVLPVVGGLGPIALYLIYNTLCFGSPFSNAYSYVMDEFREGMTRGFMGIGRPRLDVLYYITIHPVRGLFIQSPVLIAALVGFFSILKSQQWRVEGILAAFALVAYLLVNAGYFVWWGGWSFGPRHLIPMLPFLCLPLIFFPKRFFPIVVVLTVVSIVHMIIATAFSPLTPPKFLSLLLKGDAPFGLLPFFGHSPIYNFNLKFLMAGYYAPNVAMLFGLDGFLNLTPLIAVILMASIPFAFYRNSKSSKTG